MEFDFLKCLVTDRCVRFWAEIGGGGLPSQWTLAQCFTPRACVCCACVLELACTVFQSVSRSSASWQRQCNEWHSHRAQFAASSASSSLYSASPSSAPATRAGSHPWCWAPITAFISRLVFLQPSCLHTFWLFGCVTRLEKKLSMRSLNCCD